MKATIGLMLALLVWAVPAGAAADSPTVTAASGGAGVPLVLNYFDNVDAIGYQTAEYYMSGEAHSYTTGAPLTEDGKWNDIAANPDTAAYTTRVIVETPTKRRKFKGTVYVEWLNVTGLVDVSPDWAQTHIEAARRGAAFVLVSAQLAGVEQLKFGLTLPPPFPFLPGDPDRYGSLDHPGDSYSYDIFSQAGQAVRDGALLGELAPKRVKRLIAVGQSQSAGRLFTYYNAVHPLVGVYDGFIVHSRGSSSGADLSQAPLPSIPLPAVTLFRDDIDTPVIAFQTERDVFTSELQNRQPETANGNFRLWEVPGCGHFDYYSLIPGLTDIGDGQGEIENLAAMRNPPTVPPVEQAPGVFHCLLGINTGPAHWVLNAAVYWIERWVKKGKAPPIAPRLEATSAPGDPVVFAVDEHGNVLGGIRTPYVDAPIATLSGEGNGPAPDASSLSTYCATFGATIPFSDAKLAELYPKHKDFVRAFNRATRSAIKSKFLRRKDGKFLKKAAKTSDIGE